MKNKEKIKKLHGALAGLVGASATKELKNMEKVIRLAPAPDTDKAVILNAIHVLIEFNEDLSSDSWQPIETAPKDGTPILGFAGGEMTTVHWYAGIHHPGYWTLEVCGSFAENGEWNPTHWAELPEAPSE